MRSTSRQRILAYIQSKEVVTAADLSRLLHMTPANARHHLSVLRDEGVVQVIGQRRGVSRGRPVDLYRLSQPASRHNLDQLAHALLSEMLIEKDSTAQAGVFERLALRLVPPELVESKNLTQRLAQAVQYLNRMSYQARWEAHAQGPRLIFHHCPYAALRLQHPELCLLDQFLLRNMLHLNAHQIAKQELTPSGVPQCVFRVGA